MNKKAFTLIELMIVMGIVAVLTAFVIIGIGIFQQSARDAQRITTLGRINQEINNFQIINLKYPETNQVRFDDKAINIGTRIIELEDYNVPGSESSSNSTRYFYQFNNGAYILCIKLESGLYKSTGVGVLQCPNN
jgi:prepilin-type N-terminal cleavage/methylation domain-containing protein